MGCSVKPNQLEIRTNPEDGTIWAVRVQNRKFTKIRDVTKDVLYCLCADLSAVDGSEKVERSIKFADGMECKITAELV